MSNAIANASVLVELNLSVWTGQKIDRAVTSKAVNDSGASHGAGQFKKNLMAGSGKRKEISDYAQACRNWHATQTLPWSDKGPRILPTSLFLDYKATANKMKQHFDDLVQEFLRQYPIHVQVAQQNLGSMFDPTDYPPVSEIEKKFEFKLVFSPLATANDFRIDAVDAEKKELEAQYEQAFNTRVADAMQATLTKVHDLVKGMSEKLTDVEEVGEDGKAKKRRYHDSLVTNAQEMVAMLKHLNIAGDPKITAAGAELEKIIEGVDIIDIKASESTREELKKDLDAMLERDFW